MISSPMLRTRLSALTALLALGLSLEASAQTVTTTPVGAMTYTFPATTQTTTTYISIPLTNPSVYTGSVVSNTATTITFSGTPFTAGELAQSGSPFFARIASGPQAGRTMLVTANAANSISVDTTDNSSQTTPLNASSWSLTVGDRIEIIVGDTLASLLGDNTGENPLLFTGGTILGLSDSVGIYNKNTSKFDTYFYSTHANAGYWRSSLVNSNANNLVLYPDTAICVARRAGRSEAKLSVVGSVPIVSPLTKVVGLNGVVYVSTRYPVDVKLNQLTFPNWTKGLVLGQADTIGIYNAATSKFDTYFQRSDNNQWRKSGGGSVDASETVLPAGEMIAVLKRGAVSEGGSFVASALPYALIP